MSFKGCCPSLVPAQVVEGRMYEGFGAFLGCVSVHWALVCVSSAPSHVLWRPQRGDSGTWVGGTCVLRLAPRLCAEFDPAQGHLHTLSTSLTDVTCNSLITQAGALRCPAHPQSCGIGSEYFAIWKDLAVARCPRSIDHGRTQMLASVQDSKGRNEDKLAFKG